MVKRGMLENVVHRVKFENEKIEIVGASRYSGTTAIGTYGHRNTTVNGTRKSGVIPEPGLGTKPGSEALFHLFRPEFELATLQLHRI